VSAVTVWQPAWHQCHHQHHCRHHDIRRQRCHTTTELPGHVTSCNDTEPRHSFPVNTQNNNDRKRKQWWFVGYHNITRSQAVTRIADHTASQHLRGHVTSSVTWPLDSPYAISYWWSFGTKPLSLTVSETFNIECPAMVGMTLIWPLNEDSRSFILVPIDFSYTTSYRLSIVTFALGRTVLATILHAADNRRHTVPMAWLLLRLAKNHCKVLRQTPQYCCWPTILSCRVVISRLQRRGI